VSYIESGGLGVSPQDRTLEDHRLLVAYHEDGDLDARDQLVRRFLPLARQLASRYRHAGEAHEDLVQVACLGLIKAVDRYEPARGHAFTKYAVPTMLGELKRHFRDKGWAVHVPRATQELALKVSDALGVLPSKLGRAPRPRDVAEAIGEPVESVLEAMEAATAYEATSLDAPRSPRTSTATSSWRSARCCAGRSAPCPSESARSCGCASRGTSRRPRSRRRSGSPRCTSRACCDGRSTVSPRPARQPPDGMADPSGAALSDISNAVVRILRDHYGRGPTKAKTFLNDNYLVTVTEDLLTTSERTLVDKGEEELVRRMRLRFQEVVSELFIRAVEEAVDRKVVTYHSQVTFHPSLGFEIFVLEPEQ
jgi:RNA polymerase sigma factor (sigma-70 family)